VQEKIRLVAYGTGEAEDTNPYDLDGIEPSEDLPRGGDGPQDGEGVKPPRPRRVLGWTSAEGVKGIKRYASNPTKRTALGIWPIDNLIGGGVGRGEVCVIIGKSGSGKSILGQNVLESNLEVPAVFFSFEMPGTMLVTRSLAMWSGKSHNQIFHMIENNQLDEEMLANWDDAHRNHFYVTRTGLDLKAMSQALEEATGELGEKPAIVVIDYMELVASQAGGDTIDNVTSVAQLLKGWAKLEDVSCVLLHQTNKSLRHGDAPDEDAARYGGFTEADIVVGVWRPHKWEPHVRGETPMSEVHKDYLKGYYGVNLIKNRPKIDLHEKGYLVPILPSGRIESPKGQMLQDVPPPNGSGPF
jgi:KaiC/GvpD/RAD55 family RecA-like ATPase